MIYDIYIYDIYIYIYICIYICVYILYIYIIYIYVYIFCIYKSKNVRFQCCTQIYFSITEARFFRTKIVKRNVKGILKKNYGLE